VLVGLDEWAVGDQHLAVAHTHGGRGVLGLQRMPGHERAAAATLVDERVHPCQRLGEAGITRFGPLAVVDQQHVLHMSSTHAWPLEGDDERADRISTPRPHSSECGFPGAEHATSPRD
jgi:hypothetical protein